MAKDYWKISIVWLLSNSHWLVSKLGGVQGMRPISNEQSIPNDTRVCIVVLLHTSRSVGSKHETDFSTQTSLYMNARTEYKRGARYDTRLLYFNNNDPDAKDASIPQLFHLSFDL